MRSLTAQSDVLVSATLPTQKASRMFRVPYQEHFRHGCDEAVGRLMTQADKRAFVHSAQNVRLRPCGGSSLGFANLTTLAHFSVSFAMSFLKSAGEPGNTMLPSSTSRALNCGSARPALISLLSLSTISAGVSLGAPTYPVINLGIKARQKFAHTRDVGQRVRALWNCHCKRH